jgi:hypothetical protein
MGKGAGKGRGGSTDDEDERADDDEPSGSFVEKFLEKILRR